MQKKKEAKKFRFFFAFLTVVGGKIRKKGDKKYNILRGKIDCGRRRGEKIAGANCGRRCGRIKTREKTKKQGVKIRQNKV